MTRPRTPRAARTQAGLTLVELMIAMLLGLVVIAGVVSIFLAGQQSFRTNDALADVQDSSRVAFELMARDIREAGLTGCNSVNGRVVNVTAAFNNAVGAPPWWSDWSNVIHGFDQASADPALTGTAAVKTMNTLELISAASPPSAIASDTPGTSFTLYHATPYLQDGDLAMVCSPSQAALLQVGYAAGGTTVSYDGKGNCSTNLGYPNLGCAGTSPDYTFPPNSLLSKVTAVDWYIGANDVGTTSLYRMTLQNNAGAPTPTAQEMVRDVTSMQIAYLNPSVAGIDNAFQTAAVINNKNAWSGVTAVRVTLTLASTFKLASVDGKQPITRKYSFTTTLRNRVN